MSSLLQYYVPSEEFLGRELVTIDESNVQSRLNDVIMESTFKVNYNGDWYERDKKNFSKINWFISPSGFIEFLGEWHHNQHAAKLIKEMKWTKDYGHYHKLLSYDPAEYLVAIKGYIACSDGKLIYNPSRVTNSQVKKMYGDHICRTREDKGEKYFVPMSENTNQHYYSKPTAEDHAWWKVSEHQYHCPSGFLRFGYKNYLAACREWGITPASDRRYNRFSFS